MELNQFDDATVKSQAVAAGFATVELYIQRGINALEAGQHRSFDEFDREFREKNGLAPRT